MAPKRKRTTANGAPNAAFAVEISPVKAPSNTALPIERMEVSAVAARKAREAAQVDPDPVLEPEPMEVDAESSQNTESATEAAATGSLPADSSFVVNIATPTDSVASKEASVMPLAKKQKPASKCISRFTPQPGVNIARVIENGQTAGILVGLDANDVLPILLVFGVYKVQVLRGLLSIGTAVLGCNDPPLPVHAPISHPLPSLFPLETFETTSSFDVQNYTLEPPAQPFGLQQSCVILLRPLVDGITGLEALARRGNLIKRSTQMWKRKKQSEAGEWTCFDPTSGAGFEIVLNPIEDAAGLLKMPTWDQAVQSLVSEEQAPGRLCIMVEGAKQTGKSTFARLCLNALLRRYARVAFLDLDPGQSEFTPPGLLSLHVFSSPVLAPSFSALRQPMSSHFMGSVTPLQDPDYYLQAVEALHDSFLSLTPQEAVESKSELVPLVINTCGWVKGKGSEILQRIAHLVQPTHNFNISNGYSSREDSQIRLDPHISDTAVFRPPAATLRSLSILSYFHIDLPSRTWDFGLPLSARLPAICNWTTAISRVYVSHTSVPYEHILYAINASIVALVQLDSPGPALEGFPYRTEDETSRPDPKRSHCIGLSLVRSVDVQARTLSLLVPLPLETLERVNCLCLGQIELPVVAMYEDDIDVEKSQLPYFRTDDFAGGRKHVRRNLQRKEHRANA